MGHTMGLCGNFSSPLGDQSDRFSTGATRGWPQLPKPWLPKQDYAKSPREGICIYMYISYYNNHLLFFTTGFLDVEMHIHEDTHAHMHRC